MKKAKKGKFIFWIIFMVLFLILYLQNQVFFMRRDQLALDLFVFNFDTSPLPMFAFVAGFFFLGLIIAFFFGLIEKFRVKKIIQDLTQKLDEQNKMLTSQKSEIDRLRTVLREGFDINSEIKDPDLKKSVP